MRMQKNQADVDDLATTSEELRVSPYMGMSEYVHKKCTCCERSADQFDCQGYKLRNSYRQSHLSVVACTVVYQLR